MVRRLSPARVFARAHVVSGLLVGLASVIVIATAALLATPRRAGACGGTPPPPPATCGKGYSFGKVSPGTVAVPAGSGVTVNLTTWHNLVLINSNPMMPVCPPPPYNVNMTITVGNCLPSGPGVGPINVGPIPIVPGLQTIVTPITIPAGPPRNCVISVSSTVTFTDGTTIGPLTGDAQICIVEELPGQPGVPRLDLELLSPETIGTHAGDTVGATYRLTNNDSIETWDGTISGDFRNTAKQPGESPAGPIREAFGFADPGPGDDWPIEIIPNPCIPLPPDPLAETSSQVVSDPITLGPGESTDVDIVVRPWGMCADGSCGESVAVADGQFSDGTDGLACAGALYYVDNSLPPQYICPDSGAAILFDPGSDPFIPTLPLHAEPEADPGQDYSLNVLYNPQDFLVNGVPAAADRQADPTGEVGPYTGRFTETIQPAVPFAVDSFFDVIYRIEFQPEPPSAPIQTEIVQMNLLPGAPTGFDLVAPMAMGLGTIDLGIDGSVDSLMDLLTQVSGYALLDDGGIAPLQFLGFSPDPLVLPNGFELHLQAVVSGGGGSKSTPMQDNASRGSAGIEAETDSAHRGAPLPAVVQLTLMTDLRGYARAAPPACVGDLDGDGDTDVFDFGKFVLAFGSSAGDPDYLVAADFNHDGAIDVFDFGIFGPDFGCLP